MQFDAKRIGGLLVWLSFGVISGFCGEEAAGPVTLKGNIQPLLREYCYDCHNAKKQKGDLNLESIGENSKLIEHRQIWEKVAELVESREMPPEKKAQPDETQRDTLLHFIDGQLSKFDCKLVPNPGRVTIRRLNRLEYENSIRDLMGVKYSPEEFPNDEVGYGFDNIGDVLSLSPMLMEKYLAAASEVVEKAIISDPRVKPVVVRIRGDGFVSGNDWIRPLESHALGLYREGEATGEGNFSQKGEYRIRVRAYGELAGPEAPKLSIKIDGRELKVLEVGSEKSTSYEFTAVLEPGRKKITVGYLNNYNNSSDPDAKMRGDRNVFLDYIEMVAPQGVAPNLPESHKRLITRMPEPGEEMMVAREILSKFARRAYRRTVSDQEVERLLKFVELALNGKGSFLEGIQVAVQAVLCSPHFLYRWELDPAGVKSGGSRSLTNLEVASRLSYFLWCSMPDEELLSLAEKGELLQGDNLRRQALRLLKDWRARSFVNSFSGQWLQIRNLWEVSIDPMTFPKWEDRLKGAMKEESELFFQAIVQEDRDVRDLVDSDFSFLNEKLAKFYGIDGVIGEKFRRVTFPSGSPRGGVITQGSVLISTSTPTRTSPVIRGKWILEQMLGTPPPAPPADVPPLREQKQVNQTASLRQRLEAHTERVECAGCHKRMDPLGFALENFDATGSWRTNDGKFPIDASGTMPKGDPFNGAMELKRMLKSGKQFVPNLVEKMLTYAIGRGLDYYDRCAVAEVVKAMEADGYKFSALIGGIVTSESFLKRNVDTEVKTTKAP